MGLDQYAYVAAREGQKEQFWDEYDLPAEEKTVAEPREIAYWRKHPNLQGWMEQLWFNRLSDQGKEPPETSWGSSFNGVELELTWEDLEQLERDILEARLPETSGFFFGDDSSEYYKNEDLEFIKKARSEIFCGLRVFYNSSW